MRMGLWIRTCMLFDGLSVLRVDAYSVLYLTCIYVHVHMHVTRDFLTPSWLLFSF